MSLNRRVDVNRTNSPHGEPSQMSAHTLAQELVIIAMFPFFMVKHVKHKSKSRKFNGQSKACSWAGYAVLYSELSLLCGTVRVGFITR